MDKDTVLLIGVDLGNEKDCQCATLNLYYNGIDHIIYQTTDKEQVTVLNKILEEVMIEKTELQNKSLAEECWEIVKNKPFILENFFKNKGLENQQEYDKKYFWGTITEEEEAKVKEGLK